MNQYKCPSCGGRKETQAFVCGVGISGIRTLPCRTCEAKGYLTDEEILALERREAKHRERRDTRIELNLSMREMAKRMNASLVDYSDYEHGRIDL